MSTYVEQERAKFLQANFVRNMMRDFGLKQYNMTAYITTQMENDKEDMIQKYKALLRNALATIQPNHHGGEVKDRQLCETFHKIRNSKNYPELNQALRQMKGTLTETNLKDLAKEDLQKFLRILMEKEKITSMDTGFGETKLKAYLAVKEGNQQYMSFNTVENLVRYYITPNLIAQPNFSTTYEKKIRFQWCFFDRNGKRIIHPDQKYLQRLSEKAETYQSSSKTKEELIKYIISIMNILSEISLDVGNKIAYEHENAVPPGQDWNQILKSRTEIYNEGAMGVSQIELNEHFMNMAASLSADHEFIRDYYEIDNYAKGYVMALMQYRISAYLYSFENNEYAKSESIKWFKENIKELRLSIDPSAILGSPVHIGEGSHISAGCKIGSHCYVGKEVHIIGEPSGNVVIHDHVIIENDCIIIGPCEIQKYCIITSGTILYKNVDHHTKVTENTTENIKEQDYQNWLIRYYFGGN